MIEHVLNMCKALSSVLKNKEDVYKNKDTYVLGSFQEGSDMTDTIAKLELAPTEGTWWEPAGELLAGPEWSL